MSTSTENNGGERERENGKSEQRYCPKWVGVFVLGFIFLWAYSLHWARFCKPYFLFIRKIGGIFHLF